MKTVRITLALTCLAAAPHALEAAASNPGQSDNASLRMELESKLLAVTTVLDVMSDKVNKMDTCNQEGSIYTPSSPNADANGCVVPLSTLETRIVTTRHSWARGGFFTYYATCPADFMLLSCAGGTGDLDESGEYYNITPQPEQNRCMMKLGEPMPDSDRYWEDTRATVHAFCARTVPGL